MKGKMILFEIGSARRDEFFFGLLFNELPRDVEIVESKAIIIATRRLLVRSSWAGKINELSSFTALGYGDSVDALMDSLSGSCLERKVLFIHTFYGKICST